MQIKSSISRVTPQESDIKDANEPLFEKDDKPKTPPSSPVQHVPEPKKTSNVVRYDALDSCLALFCLIIIY